MMALSLATEQFLDVKEVAQRLHISGRTLRRLIARREISVFRVGGAVRISESALSEYLQKNFTPAAFRRLCGPVDVETIIDRVLLKKRGRPRVGGAT